MLDTIGHRIQPLLGIRQSALKDETGYAGANNDRRLQSLAPSNARLSLRLAV